MNEIKSYIQQLASGLNDGWNRFWFTPRDPIALCYLRILAGLSGLYFLASFTSDLVRWFGADGILNTATTSRLTGADQLVSTYRVSLLYLAESPQSLWALHAVSLLVLAAYTVGLWSRWTNLAAAAVVLSYVHRGPMITGQFEPVLTMLLIYLCLGNTGRYLSIDAMLARRKSRLPERGNDATIASNISTRLIQLHLAGLCLTVGLSMLAGEVWWSGEAVWWLITRTESRLIDLTGLSQAFLLVNIWTHGMVIYQLLFGVLIWHRLGRPLLLTLSVFVWTSLALITGQTAWCVIMIITGAAFIDPIWLQRRLSGTDQQRPVDGTEGKRSAASAGSVGRST